MSTADKNSRTPLYTGLGVVALAVIGGGTAMVTTASNQETHSTVASDTSASPEASTTPSASASSSLFASPSGEADASTEASPLASDAPSIEETTAPSPSSSANAETPVITAEATAGAAVAPEVATPSTSEDQMVTGHENQVSVPSTEAPVTGHEIVVPEAGVHPEDQMVTGVNPVAPTPSYSTEISTQSDAYGNPLDPSHTQVLSAVVYEHAVVAGDTVSHLATLYGTSIEAIAQYNQLANADMIEVGQVLYVPTVSVG